LAAGKILTWFSVRPFRLFLASMITVDVYGNGAAVVHVPVGTSIVPTELFVFGHTSSLEGWIEYEKICHG
jgi:hypothetical protein